MKAYWLAAPSFAPEAVPVAVEAVATELASKPFLAATVHLQRHPVACEGVFRP